MPKRTRSFKDSLLKDLADPREAAWYVNAALEDSEEMLLVALGDVAEARQMSKVASEAGLSRESICRMLGEGGDFTYASLQEIFKELGLKLTVQARRSRPERPVQAESLPHNSRGRR
jgi:probable addiction module antidote protein